MTRPTAGPAVVSAGVAAVVLRRLDRGGATRPNFHGTAVTLSAGPAVAAGLLAGALMGRGRTGTVVCVAGAAVAGWYDDRASLEAAERRTKGFAGHLSALATGRPSAGAVKLGVIGATSLIGATLRRGVGVDALVDGCLVAGSANLVNLFDLRPGRALKVAGLATLAAAPFERGPMPAAVCGAIAAVVAADLGERSMLGDTGANALGAAVGTMVCGRSRRVRVAAVAAISVLTALSERVSFSAVIAERPLLQRLDQLGRARG